MTRSPDNTGSIRPALVNFISTSETCRSLLNPFGRNIRLALLPVSVASSPVILARFSVFISGQSTASRGVAPSNASSRSSLYVACSSRALRVRLRAVSATGSASAIVNSVWSRPASGSCWPNSSPRSATGISLTVTSALTGTPSTTLAVAATCPCNSVTGLSTRSRPLVAGSTVTVPSRTSRLPISASSGCIACSDTSMPDKSTL